VEIALGATFTQGLKREVVKEKRLTQTLVEKLSIRELKMHVQIS
jgi:hypothetical protein